MWQLTDKQIKVHILKTIYELYFSTVYIYMSHMKIFNLSFKYNVASILACNRLFGLCDH